MTDLLLVNGTVRTMDPARPRARSVACAGGRIESLDETPPAKRTLDLKGRTVVPGFVDAHAHLLMLGRSLSELDLTGVTDAGELVRRARERAAALPEGAWVVGSGHDLQGAPPYAALSEATPDHPAWLRRKDGHSALANARAAAMADRSAVPAGGEVRWGEGLFLETATRLVEDLIPPESPSSAFLAAQRLAMQSGVTAVHDAAVDGEYLRLLRSLEEGRSLRLRVHAMVHDDDPDRLIDFMRSQPPRTGRLSARAVKVYMDGSLGSGTARMLAPPLGTSRLSPEQLERVGRAALETGYQLCAHAIGDRANREVLDVFERIDPPAEARWRIEHAQHVDAADLPRMRRWIASIQPSHAVADRAKVEALGPERAGTSYAWKRLGRLALGTDTPVERLDPRWTFYCAVTRDGWRPEDCLSPGEALRGMTADAAWAGFMDGGVLAPGRPADMAVLSRDWLEVPAGEVPGSEVLATLMDGRVGYMSRGFGR